jgi:hypothetical protein
MNTRSLTQQSDEYERRSPLVSLAYEVLREMKTPADDATSMAMCSDLSRAFLEATALAIVAATAPRVRGPKPANMNSTAR